MTGIPSATTDTQIIQIKYVKGQPVVVVLQNSDAIQPLTHKPVGSFPQVSGRREERWHHNIHYNMSDSVKNEMFRDFGVISRDFAPYGEGIAYLVGIYDYSILKQWNVAKAGYTEHFTSRISSMKSNMPVGPIFAYKEFKVASPKKVEKVIKSVYSRYCETGEHHSFSVFAFQDLLCCQNGDELFKLLYSVNKHPEVYQALEAKYLATRVTRKQLIAMSKVIVDDIVDLHLRPQTQIVESSVTVD